MGTDLGAISMSPYFHYIVDITYFCNYPQRGQEYMVGWSWQHSSSIAGVLDVRRVIVVVLDEVLETIVG